MDPEQVKIGRKEELEFMVEKLDMFEFGTYEEAVSRRGRHCTSGVEEVDVQDGGCGEEAAEEKGARGGEADVYRREESPLQCEVRGRRVGGVA